MSPRLVVSSLTSALAGFLFGFDTVVISGAERTIQDLWQLTPWVHGLVMSAALWGTVAGALAGAWPTDRAGRRPTLIAVGVLYVVSAVWSALAGGPWSLAVARAVGGVGVGIATVASPLYISEIAPPAARGRLAGLFQLNIVLGILVAFVSNAVIGATGDAAWRWMLGVEAVPALVYALLCIGIPESPRWLAQRGDMAAAEAVLRQIEPAVDADGIRQRLTAMSASTREVTGVDRFWSAPLRTPILLAVTIAAFNQLSGINAVLYFAPRIFELTGLGASAALLQSVGIGVTNLVFTLAGLWLIDRAGRRTLLIVGSAGYIGSLGLCAWAFFTNHLAIVPACIFAFIAAHALGQGAVIWVFIAEVFPTRYRAAGQALGSFTHWMLAALLTALFPTLVTSFHPGSVFLFFCLMMAVQLAWVLLVMPETRGRTLEQIADDLGA